MRQAFVEKHHFYHNHLLSAVEDPESKDYDAKTKVLLSPPEHPKASMRKAHASKG